MISGTRHQWKINVPAKIAPRLPVQQTTKRSILRFHGRPIRIFTCLSFLFPATAISTSLCPPTPPPTLPLSNPSNPGSGLRSSFRHPAPNKPQRFQHTHCSHLGSVVARPTLCSTAAAHCMSAFCIGSLTRSPRFTCSMRLQMNMGVFADRALDCVADAGEKC